MARGWESKSVESQIEDAGSRSSRSSTSSQDELLKAEQRAVWNKLQDLELSRRRVLQDLATARSVLRRTALEQALAFLDQEIRKLAPPGSAVTGAGGEQPEAPKGAARASKWPRTTLKRLRASRPGLPLGRVGRDGHRRVGRRPRRRST